MAWKNIKKTTLTNFWKIVTVVFFILLLGIGIVIHDDYGGYTDELIEIQTGMIQLKYVFSKIPMLEDISGLNIPLYGNFAALPDLATYEDRIYGSAAMLPTFFVNYLPGISLDVGEFLNFRRFYNFLNFFLAAILFYLFLQKRFRNPLIALTGTLMLVLSPRIFAESFYNCKDILFLSWFLISLLGIGFYQLDRKKYGLVLFGFAFGLAANTRFYGFILLPAFAGIAIFDMITDPKNRKKILRQTFLTCIASIVWFFILTPFLWESDFQQIIGGLKVAVDQPVIGDAELFMGRFVAPRDVWYYLPVWIGITVPVLYLALFVIGSAFLPFKLQSLKDSDTRFELAFDIMNFLLFVIAIMAIVISKGTIYHGWRHAYFLYAPFIYISVCGLNDLIEFKISGKTKMKIKNGIVFSLCLLSFANTGWWMIKNHPLDFVYFNEIGKNYAEDFTRDYWGVASKSCLLYLYNAVQVGEIRVGVNSDLTYGSAEITLLRMPEAVRKRFTPVWQMKNADYLCYSYKNTPGNDYQIPDFAVMKTFMVDGYAVMGVYQRINPAE
ncbi:MAG TPA: glycosyltransferase family 39 protein [Flexilinea sp.]|nr:glycosyltransferase family 39 protein [Flexilinea sp.]